MDTCNNGIMLDQSIERPPSTGHSIHNTLRSSPGITTSTTNNNTVPSSQFNMEAQFINFESPSNTISEEDHYQDEHRLNPSEFEQYLNTSTTQQINEHSHQNWADFHELNDIDMNLGYYTEPHQQQHSNGIIAENFDTTPNSTHSLDQLTSPTMDQAAHFGNIDHKDVITTLHNSLQVPNGTGIRPDMVFTPLMSPVVGPLDTGVGRSSKAKSNRNVGSGFSPLSSPAILAKSPGIRRKSISPTNSGSNINTISGSNSSKTSKKGKTPGSTPIVGPTVPGRISKQSPMIKAKRTTSYVNTMSQIQQQQQGQTSLIQQQQYRAIQPSPVIDFKDISLPDAYGGMAPPKSTANGNLAVSSRKKSSTTPILSASSTPLVKAPVPITINEMNPPQSTTIPLSISKTPVLKASVSSASINSNSSSSSSHPPVTPATLMNFRLESSGSTSLNSSPVILPSSSSSSSNLPINNRRKSSSTTTTQNIKITPKSTPLLAASKSTLTQDEDDEDMDPNTKKASHKLAEQGRRNRMNKAIQELSATLPEHLTASVQIPSKATTVELANLFILDLIKENRQLKDIIHMERQTHLQQIQKIQHGINSGNLSTNEDGSSNGSISPLDANNNLF